MPLKCLVCVIEQKGFENLPTAVQLKQERPVLRDAVTMCATNLSPTTFICYEHLEIGRQSPLAVPNGVRLPPIGS